MKIALLCANERVGRLVQSSLSGVSAKIYGDVANINEEKVLFILYSFSEDVIQYMLQILKDQEKDIFAIIRKQELDKMGPILRKKGISYLVNGEETDDKLYSFLGMPKKVKRSLVFIGPVGGSGKSFLSSYIAKKASESLRIRLVDWNYETPSLYYYFNVSSSTESVVKALKLIRNDLPLNLKEYDYKAGPNLNLALMSLDYLESTKWKAEDFAYLWDYYEGLSDDAIIYEVPNHPFSITSAVALMRATDVVIPLVADQRAVANSIALVNWIKTYRELDMPEIHFVLNRYDGENTAMSVSEIEKTLGYKVQTVISEIPEATSLFISGEIMKDKTLLKDLHEKVGALHTFVKDLGLSTKEEPVAKAKMSFVSKILRRKSEVKHS